MRYKIQYKVTLPECGAERGVLGSVTISCAMRRILHFLGVELSGCVFLVSVRLGSGSLVVFGCLERGFGGAWGIECIYRCFIRHSVIPLGALASRCCFSHCWRLG